jgi:predicted amino acid dehydrogenase
MESFGFIIHPIDARRDMAKKYPLARFLPERFVELLIKKMEPRVISYIQGVKSITGAEAEGWFVGCPLTPRQFLQLPEDFVISKIVRAARIAQDMGAKIVGLGAFTSVAGDAGISVESAVDIAVTTGNTYTIATALEATRKAAALMEIDLKKAAVAVVGASGAIGSVCARILAREAPRVILVGRNLDRLYTIADAIRPLTSVTCSKDVDASLREADVVLTVTSAAEAVIKPESLRIGSVVCDVARPRDVSPLVAKARPDVLVIEGGVVSVPGDVEFNFNFGFPPKTAYACMAETMILALERRYESFSLGRKLKEAKVKEIADLAAKHGFSLAGFRCFERALTDEDIDRVRLAADMARRRVTQQ